MNGQFLSSIQKGCRTRKTRAASLSLCLFHPAISCGSGQGRIFALSADFALLDRVLAAYNKCGTFSQKLCCSFFVFVYFYNKFISCSYFVHKSLVYFKHLKRDGLPKIYSVMFSLHIKINFFIIASRYTRCRGALLILREKSEARDFSQCQKSRAVFYRAAEAPCHFSIPGLALCPLSKGCFTFRISDT